MNAALTTLKVTGWLALAIFAPFVACSLYLATSWDDEDEDDEE